VDHELRDFNHPSKVMYYVRDVLFADVLYGQMISCDPHLAEDQLEPEFECLVYEDEVEFIWPEMSLIAVQASLQR